MAQERFDVGVVVARVKLKGPWASHAWLPRAVLPQVPEAAPWTPLDAGDDEETFYAGAAEVSLHAGETAHYRDNLSSGRPSLWVVLQSGPGERCELLHVTADPYEGEALAGEIGSIVEPVPMPADVQRKLAAFFEVFHVEREFVKRKRDRADPEALARRGPLAPRPENER